LIDRFHNWTHRNVKTKRVFLEKRLEVEGVENVVFNANGTFYIVINDKPYL